MDQVATAPQQPPAQADPIRVDVEGVGPVEFPAGTSQAEMESALKQLSDQYQQTKDPSVWDRLKSAAYQASPLPLFEKQNLPTTAAAVAGAATGGLMAIPVAGLTAMAVSGAQGNAPDQNIKAGLLNAGAEGFGVAAGPMGQRLMQSALKPGVRGIVKDIRAGVAVPPVVQTMLDEGINVTQGGIAKLQTLLTASNKAIKDAIAPLTGQIERPVVAARALTVGKQMANQTNPTADLKALGNAVDEFLNPPVMGGPLSPQEAQAMKVGTYKQIGDKYGTPAALNPAQVQAQMAFARGLKEEIEHLAATQGQPNIRALNAREGRVLEALEATAKRVAQAGNTNPAGFAFATHAPLAFVAALMDRSPVIKSMLARGLYKSASQVSGVSPQLLRTAMAAIASTPDEVPNGP